MFSTRRDLEYVTESAMSPANKWLILVRKRNNNNNYYDYNIIGTIVCGGVQKQ